MKKFWMKIKKWVYGLLVAVGLAAPILVQGATEFGWDNPTTRTDGSVLPIEEIQETRLYCDGAFTDSAPSPDNTLTVDLPFGNHTCYVTTVDIYGQESDPSVSVTFVTTPARPNPPVLRVN